MKKLIAALLVLTATSCAHKAHDHQAEGNDHYHGEGTQADLRFPAGRKVGSFACSNAPAKKWGTYFCAYGTFTSPKQLLAVVFGTCEGSSAAEEEEPVSQVNFDRLSHDANLAGSSSAWRDASAFNVTSKEHGPATLLLQPELFEGTKDKRVDARLKITVNGQEKDVRLINWPL
jgi:hypothetical protein